MLWSFRTPLISPFCSVVSCYASHCTLFQPWPRHPASQTHWQGQVTSWIQISLSNFNGGLVIVLIIFGYALPSSDLHMTEKQAIPEKPPSSLTLIPFLDNNPSLRLWLSVFEEKSIQASKFNTFLSAELQSFRQLTRQCSEWVSFYTLPCQFSGSYASGGCGEVSHRHRPSQKLCGGNRPLIVWWDYRGTEEGLRWTKALDKRQKHQQIHIATRKILLYDHNREFLMRNGVRWGYSTDKRGSKVGKHLFSKNKA